VKKVKIFLLGIVVFALFFISFSAFGSTFYIKVYGKGGPIYTLKGKTPAGSLVGYMAKFPISPTCLTVLTPPGGFSQDGVGLDKMVEARSDVYVAINGDLFNRTNMYFKAPIGTYVADGHIYHYVGASTRGSFIGLKDGRYMWMRGQPYIYTFLESSCYTDNGPWGKGDRWILFNPENGQHDWSKVKVVIYTEDVNEYIDASWGNAYLVRDDKVVGRLTSPTNPHEAGGMMVVLKDGELCSGDSISIRSYVRVPWSEWFGDNTPDEYVPIEDVSVIFSGGPMLIYKGDKADFWTDDYHTKRHPFSFIGMTKDFKLTMLVFDGRQNGYSNGVLTSEVIDWAMKNGFVYLLALDSGGSTVMVERIGDDVKVVNRPSDGRPRPMPVGIGWKSTCGSDRP